MERHVESVEDVLALLDTLFDDGADRWSSGGGADWWDAFYADRERGVPFFREAPDESLVAWHEAGRLPRGGRVLDLGSGPGRNAVWLAQQGYAVDAVDLSAEAVRWGGERASAAGVDVRFVHGDAFALEVDEPYDLVYDSGCFHHLPPHRRLSHRWLLERALRPGGAFGLVCFAWGAMGTQAPDVDLYRAGGLAGGVAYRDDDLRRLFGWLRPVELRRMEPRPDDSPVFGEDFLWAGLFERPA
ncbi:class I SAM-dependent methyltransferase [Aeromicrobium sp. IC_218]|uniref:class I SAM-dependent methyltransferase n=1 Tax=Aeromicrobium sp. IC_218 TaxID=2545468 RepID=UPI00103D3668|nr:class I SAM-dependent methyltransferase [Aeromicrobium sp. IC_218]TCI99711.1 class I SAM-dependent methyltransferase [Aeromicrobium sp. IC_218]